MGRLRAMRKDHLCGFELLRSRNNHHLVLLPIAWRFASSTCWGCHAALFYGVEGEGEDEGDYFEGGPQGVLENGAGDRLPQGEAEHLVLFCSSLCYSPRSPQARSTRPVTCVTMPVSSRCTIGSGRSSMRIWMMTQLMQPISFWMSMSCILLILKMK